MNDSQLLEVSKALSNAMRLQILTWLADPAVHFEVELIKPIGICVSHIQRKANMSASTISSYLTVLQKNGLVMATREGQWTFYQLNRDRFEEVIAYLGHAFGVGKQAL